MRELVVNAPTCSSTGMPVRNCNCEWHQPSQEPKKKKAVRNIVPVDEDEGTRLFKSLEYLANRQDAATGDEDNLLPVFNIDWEEMASPALRKSTTTETKTAKRRDESDNLLPVFNIDWDAYAASDS